VIENKKITSNIKAGTWCRGNLNTVLIAFNWSFLTSTDSWLLQSSDELRRGCQQHGGGHAYALDLGFEGVGQGVAPKKCNGSKRGEQFHGGGEAHGLDIGFEDEGHGFAPKNAMDPREGNDFIVAAKHMD
jgi:hypothetical protein